ncbi:MAG: glycerophosphodiester phosphodiesterase family protein [Thermomicrobiales bacterium]
MVTTIYAHRGASAEKPENTLAAFGRALELGAYGIELDVHLSRDGVPVVMHDERVDRTTDGTGEIAELSLLELQQLDAGGGERVPTLAEVCDLVEGRVHLNIEVKANAAAEAVMHEVLQRPNLRWAISSFDWDVLRTVRKQHGQAELWPLTIGATEDALALAEEIRAHQLNLYDAAVDEDIVVFLRDRGIGAWVWTVNDPKRAADLVGWGAVGICTDDPARIQNVVSPD